MKPSASLLLAAVLVTSGCQSANQPAPVPVIDNVTVSFQEPDNFTDVSDSFGGSTSQYYLDLISEHLQKTATGRLAEGQKLKVIFTDIDLAGDIPPGRTDNVRFVQSIYIPRMQLTFELKDAKGTTLRQGERCLIDLDFQSKMTSFMDRNGPLNYDKEMLADWVKREFPLKG